MKFVKFILNTLMFCLLTICSFLVCCGVSWSLSLQTKSNDTGFVFWSSQETSVGLNDAIGFWGDSVQANYATYKKQDFSKKIFVVDPEGITIKVNGEEVVIKEITANVAGPKFRCRNWIPWNWYKNSIGLWLDYAVDAVTAVCSPILLPTLNVKDLERFYGKELIDFRQEIDEKIPNQSHYYEDAVEALYNAQSGEAYAQWVDKYPVMYDYMFKIAKYNSVDDQEVPIYAKYYTKFVGEDRIMNSSVVLLYYTILIDLIVSLWIVIQYPIAIKQLDDGTSEASGGLIKRRKKKK